MNYGAPIWLSFGDPDVENEFFYVNARLIAGWQCNKTTDGRNKVKSGEGSVLILFGGTSLFTSESFPEVTKKMLELKIPNEIGEIET